MKKEQHFTELEDVGMDIAITIAQLLLLIQINRLGTTSDNKDMIRILKLSGDIVDKAQSGGYEALGTFLSSLNLLAHICDISPVCKEKADELNPSMLEVAKSLLKDPPEGAVNVKMHA